MRSLLGMAYLYDRKGIYYLRYRPKSKIGIKPVNHSLLTRDRGIAMAERDKVVLLDLGIIRRIRVTEIFTSRMIKEAEYVSAFVNVLPDNVKHRIINSHAVDDVRKVFSKHIRDSNGCANRRISTIDTTLIMFISFINKKTMADITEECCLSFASCYQTCHGTRGKRPDLTKSEPDIKLRPSPTTVRSVFNLINRFFEWCIKKRHLVRLNPFSVVDIPRRTQNRRRAPPQEVVELLCNLPRHPKLTVSQSEWDFMPLMARYTGARMGEIARLQISDVTHIHGILCLEMPQGKARLSGLSSDAKRVVPVHSKLLPHLMPFVNSKKSGPLFTTLGDCSRSYEGLNILNVARAFNMSWNKAAKKIFKTMSFHCWRSYAITRMNNSGHKPACMMIVGHSTRDVNDGYQDKENITKEELNKLALAIESIV